MSMVLLLATSDKKKVDWSNPRGIAEYTPGFENNKIFNMVTQEINKMKYCLGIGYYNGKYDSSLGNEPICFIVITNAYANKTGYVFEYVNVAKSNILVELLMPLKKVHPNSLVDYSDLEEIKKIGIAKSDWKYKIFIGSSKESRSEADYVASLISQKSPFVHPIHWIDSFPPGSITLQQLIKVLDNSDAGIFIMGNDDKVHYRNNDFSKARDNVLLEYGLWVGKLGYEKVAICKEKNVTLPTDVLGLSVIVYDQKVKEDYLARENLLRFIDHLIPSQLSGVI